MGEPPPGLLALSDWYDRILAVVAYQIRHERGSREIWDEVRATCRTFRGLMPSALAADAESIFDTATIDGSGNPPEDALARAVWYAKAIAADLWSVLTGDTSKGSGLELRRTASAICIPPAEMHAARKAITERGKLIKDSVPFKPPDEIDPRVPPVWRVT